VDRGEGHGTDATTLGVMTLTITTLAIMTLNMKMLSITTHSIIIIHSIIDKS